MKKNILISGCSSGLGKHIAESLEAKGFKVYAGMRENNMESYKRLWKQDNKDITVLRLDITSNEQCKKAIEQIIKNDGHIDFLLNNAGYTLVGPAEDFSAQDFLKILDTNTVGASRLIKNVLPHMKKQKNGKIINITSLNSMLALPNFAMYCASKFALEAFALALRYEVAKHNVWVTSLAPGAIANPEEKSKKDMPHKPAREKFLLLKILMPFLTYDKIAGKIERILEKEKPPAEVIMGSDAHITTLLQRLLPRSLWDRLVLYVWNK